MAEVKATKDDWRMVIGERLVRVESDVSYIKDGMDKQNIQIADVSQKLSELLERGDGKSITLLEAENVNIKKDMASLRREFWQFKIKVAIATGGIVVIGALWKFFPLGVVH